MRVTWTFVCAVAALLLAPAAGQAFDGVYQVSFEGQQMVMKLQVDGAGTVIGSLSMEGMTNAVRGKAKGKTLTGTINVMGESVRFRAKKSGDKLSVTMFEVGTNHGETLVFRKAGGASAPAKAGKGKVVINGTALTAAQVKALVRRYRVQPLPGKYWYDNKSGLYGVVGHGAFGFMHPGHGFGKMSRGVSRGNTRVVVNGRELPQQEWLVWSGILGYPIQPGNYWLDAKGNAGYVGNPTPTVNLYAAARAQQYRHAGGGRGSDNFWSTRFSAGNSDRGGTRGYVSVPGHGPVGYGF